MFGNERNKVKQMLKRELEDVQQSAKNARQSAVGLSDATPSASGERALAESTDDFWQDKVRKVEALSNQFNSATPSGRVDIGAVLDLDIDGEDMRALYTDLNLQLSSSEITTITPASPVGKLISGLTVGGQAKLNENTVVKVKKIF